MCGVASLAETRTIALLVLGLTSCLEGPVPPTAPGTSEAGYLVAVEPDAELTNAPAVLRLRIESEVPIAPEALALFEGELKSYHRGRVAKNDLPKTLEELRVPALSFGGDGVSAPVTFAPLAALEPNTTYSLGLLGTGVLAEVVIRESPEPLRRRIFPPAGVPHTAAYAVYCADGAAPRAALPESAEPLFSGALEPEGIQAKLFSGADASGTASDRCVHLLLEEELSEGQVVLPPLGVPGAALEPAPLESTRVDAAKPLVCAAGEVALGPACAVVSDDRLVVDTPPGLSFLALHAPGHEWMASGVGPFHFGGLEPEREFVFELTAVDLAGRVESASARVHTLAPRDHLVINEVLANPIGPEPAQEWVELYNDGRTPVALEGYVLEDIGGSAALPQATLGPGEFALVVREDFDPRSPYDAEPRPGTLLLRVPDVGKNGLLNSGEPLFLRDALGLIVSSTRLDPKPKPGLSVARVTPSALSERADAFALHGAPGSSPGAPNAFDQSE